MSGKTSPSPVSWPLFYGESPPKKSRLQDCNNLRPPFKSFKEQLVNFDKKLSEPIKSPEPVEAEPIALAEPANESKSLDRDSPLPLKNLGNTCYENSIIQCLFSLDIFMENFKRSMERMRKFVVRSRREPSEQTKVAPNQSDQNNPLEQNDIKISTINEDDNRFHVTHAFDNLYKSYTQRKTKLETNATSKKSSGIDNDSLNLQQQPSSEVDPTTTTTASPSSQPTQNLTPIALVSSTAHTNEQSEIETRLEDLKSAVGERSSQFNSTHQQDASEFFYHVIDSIQEFYQSLGKTSDEDNPVTKAFELELDYLIRCPKCQHKIISGPEKIRTLSLALPHVQNETTSNQETELNQEISRVLTPPTSDLGLDSPTESHNSDEQRAGSEEKENQALVNGSSSSTTVETNNQSSSNSDGTSSLTNLGLTVKAEQASDQPQAQVKPHHTLCDALNNYFKDDILEYKCPQTCCDSKQRTKKCLIRKLPQVLFITLARYYYTGKKNLDEIEAPFELSVPFRENKSPSHSPSTHRDFSDHDNKYQLVAVVCHLGLSLNAGHYTSYVYNQNNFSWYSCDDDSITKVQESEVKNDASKSGYCFFYAHKSCIAQRPEADNTPISVVMEEEEHATREIVTMANCVEGSSVVLTPESSPSPSTISQDDSGYRESSTGDFICE